MAAFHDGVYLARPGMLLRRFVPLTRCLHAQCGVGLRSPWCLLRLRVPACTAALGSAGVRSCHAALAATLADRPVCTGDSRCPPLRVDPTAASRSSFALPRWTASTMAARTLACARCSDGRRVSGPSGCRMHCLVTNHKIDTGVSELPLSVGLVSTHPDFTIKCGVWLAKLLQYTCMRHGILAVVVAIIIITTTARMAGKRSSQRKEEAE